jgi:hypothetical protein
MTTNDTSAPVTSPATPTPAADELAYLQAHGEDVSDLRQELEQLLPSSRAPEAPRRDVTADPNYRLPITREGADIQVSQPAPQPQTPIEKALDPLAPDAPRSQPDQDGEPGEVMIDGEGKLRDAKTGRYVPHQAFHAEREQRKAAEAKAAKLQEDFIKTQERLSVLTEIIQGQDALVKQVQQPQPDATPQPEPEIDPEVDVFASVKQMQKRDAERAARLAEIEKTANQRIDAIQQEARYRQEALNFSLKNPDFPEAYKFFNECRREELKLLGYSDEAGIDQQIMREERALMAQGFKMPGGPAQMVYKLAQNRGYRPKAPTPTPDPTPAPAPQAAAPAPAPTPPPAPAAPAQQPIPQVAPDAREAIQRVQNGQQAAATLSGAGGVPGEGMTVEQLANMSDDDFLQFATKIGSKKLDRLLGWGG